MRKQEAKNKNMHKISSKGLALIKEFEGFSATPYICSGGHLTIGYGHLIKANEHYERVTKIDAEQLLLQDVAASESAVLRLISVPLTSSQFDALVSFTFNLGAGALQRSTLRIKINRMQHDEVASEFMRWVFAGGRKIKGLVKRRKLEAALYNSNSRFD